MVVETGRAGRVLEDRVIFLTYCLRINYRLLHPLHSQVQPDQAQILAKDRMARLDRVLLGGWGILGGGGGCKGREHLRLKIS